MGLYLKGLIPFIYLLKPAKFAREWNDEATLESAKIKRNKTLIRANTFEEHSHTCEVSPAWFTYVFDSYSIIYVPK
jgi:hypothetical protein